MTPQASDASVILVTRHVSRRRDAVYYASHALRHSKRRR